MIIAYKCQCSRKVTFTTLDEVYAYAEINSISFRNAGQQSILIKYQTLASKLRMFNLKGSGSFTLTDKTKLNPNFITAEVFGSPEGIYRAITFRQNYVSNFTFEPQIALINLYAMAQVRVSKNQ